MLDIGAYAEAMRFVRHYRVEHTKTWVELAEEIGISDTTARAAIMEGRNTSKATAQKIIDFYARERGLFHPEDKAQVEVEPEPEIEIEPEGVKADTRSENSMTYDFCLIETRNVINQIASAITVVEEYMKDNCEKDTAIDCMADAMGSIAVISRELNRLRIKEEN